LKKSSARNMVKAPENWAFSGEPDRQSVNRVWDIVGQVKIEGVETKPVQHVLAAGGCLTEVFRADWNLPGGDIDQIFVRSLEPGAVTAWHCHAQANDRLFCVSGRILLALFDGRTDSSSYGAIATYRLGVERPMLVVIPPGVWHGTKCLSHQPSLLLNAVDRAYSYETPDHWRVPQDYPEIGFDFDAVH